MAPKGTGQDYQPTGLPPTTMEIIATGGDAVGAASIFLNPLFRGIGTAITNYRIAANQEIRDYAKEADDAASAAKKAAIQGAYNNEMAEIALDKARYEVALMEKEYLRKERRKNSPYKIYFQPDIRVSPDMRNSPEMNNSSVSQTGDVGINNQYRSRFDFVGDDA